MSDPAIRELLASLPNGHARYAAFTPHARYFPDMDMLLYVSEDCSYATERADGYLSLLWHPAEDRVIGFKLKGAKYAFNAVKDKVGMDDAEWVSLYQLLEAVFTKLMSEAPEKWKYVVAKSLAGTEKILRSELVTA